MKTMLRSAVAAIALVGFTGTAIAQTNQLHYASPGPIPYAITNPGPLGTFAGELGVALGVGTRYIALSSAPGDTEDASPEVTTTFILTGEVNKDCSFYAGNTAAATNIDFGTIGVRTGDNENVGSAFEMAGDLNASIQTLTAGCNFNNTVAIAKGNQTGGMQLVGNPGGFDTTQFQSNIPYEVVATWSGVALDFVGSGSDQELAVSTGQPGGSIDQGAWRSDMLINITAPAVTNRGLVAGQYRDQLTVTLTAL